MAGYIKSHSNYRLQSRHQLVNNGAIFERDISTVGGVNSFATGQATIYQSGNFVMVVNNTSSAPRHIKKKGWLASGNNDDVWNQKILSQYSSDITGSIEREIMLKNDFMDLRSFAYYGSLAALIENTVTKIVSTFPYEIYVGDETEYITNHSQKSRTTSTAMVVDDVRFNYVEIELGYGQTVKVSDNVKIFINENDTWQIFEGNTFSSDSDSIILRLGIQDYGIAVTINYDLETKLYKVSNPGGVDIHSKDSGDVTNNSLGHFYNDGYKNYNIVVNNQDYKISKWTVTLEGTNECLMPGDYVGSISIKYLLTSDDEEEGDEVSCVLQAYVNNERRIDYYAYKVSESDTYHIRPREDMSFYDDFVDGLDLFGKCLIGVYSGVKNTAKFEVLSEGQRGIERTIETFVFPYGPGGYNLGSEDTATQNYIYNLGRIGLSYDEIYTDNMFRMMTHDSLKNLDWTSNFNGNEGDYDNEYIQTGRKFASIMRIIGYVFDQEKAYIDAMSNVNTITYSNRANLSDYFLTDALETDGFVVNTIYPYNLTEYDNKGEEVHDWDEEEQKNNLYTRMFSENTSEIITPYSYFDGAFYTTCVSGETVTEEIEDYNGQVYYADESGVHNVLTNYHDDTEMTVPEVNNEFMKRLKINSRALLRKKGTISGIESLLSLFGFRSKRWCGDNSTSYDYEITEKTYLSNPIWETWDNVHGMHRIDWYNSCKTIPYDTEAYINGEYIPYQGLPVAYRNDDRYNYNYTVNYNQFVSARTEVSSSEWSQVVVDSENRILFGVRNDGSAYTPDLSGHTVPGTERALTEVIGGLVKPRKLYPSFQSSGIYDGNMYYQMYGGWIGYSPYSFDKGNRIFEVNDFNAPYVRVETKRNIVQAKDINELLNQPIGDLYDGMVYYVLDTSAKYAIVNGQPYPLKEESFNGDEVNYYFETDIYGGTITVGERLYEGVITISDIHGESGFTDVNLSLYADGTTLKIYYTGHREEGSQAFYIKSENETEPTNSTLIFIDGSYTSGNTVSHYFVLGDSSHPDFLGEYYWRQVDADSWEYKVYENILDNTNGNNPHSGNFIYDSGNEYLYRYGHLFIYASTNRYFNESCFPSVEEAYDDIDSYGFTLSGCSDTKVHAFVDTMSTDGQITKYDLNDNTYLKSLPAYSGVTTDNNDGVTAQILNVKNFDFTFYLKATDLYTKEGQEELKYIQDKVMPYVEQMLPSGAIVDVTFHPSTPPETR